MRYDEFYGQSTEAVLQPVAAPESPARDTTAPASPISGHVGFAWLGVLIAIVLLRVVYEVSEE